MFRRKGVLFAPEEANPGSGSETLDDVRRKLADAQTNLESANAQNAQFAADAENERVRRRTAEAATLVSELLHERKLSPALSKGLAEFVAGLPGDGDEALEFSIDGKTIKTTPRAYFIEWARSLPEYIPKKGEFAKRSGEGQAITIDRDDLDERVRAYAAKNSVSYTVALDAIMKGATK